MAGAKIGSVSAIGTDAAGGGFLAGLREPVPLLFPLERDRFKSITLYTYFGEQVGRF
jgi:hypothetical protein